MLTTAAQLLERYDSALLAQLTDSAGVAVNEAMVVRALGDAAAEIEGYLFRLPLGTRPPAETLEAHQAAMAMYRLAGNRPGIEFDSIRARNAQSIEWLKTLGVSPAHSVGVGVGHVPCPQFDEASLDEFGGRR